MNSQHLSDLFSEYKEESLSGRYITSDLIQPLIDQYSKLLDIQQVGMSENDLPIYLIKLGTGSKTLVYWSQMHGNESTTTKAVFDFLKLLTHNKADLVAKILEECTLYIIPILNPDGAKAYTRLNYHNIDLNRDAQDLSQKESLVLDKVLRQYKPDFAFNLHGQRTIFSAGLVNKPATVSFLSPAAAQNRNITESRKKAMDVIVYMNKVLQKFIPGQVGRYDDGFNLNCVGDTLSSRNIPVILFEAGHYPKDYEREEARKFIFYSLISSAYYIATEKITGNLYDEYFEIPENEKLFYDIIIRDVILDEKNVDIAIQYEEILEENVIKFLPKVVKIDNLKKFYAHREIIGKKRSILNENVRNQIVPEAILLNFRLDTELFSTELVKS